MASIQQIDANRRNAQRSTGPLTPEGKHAASGNALKSGIYAEALIIPGERAEDLETLTAEYHHRFHPTTPEARDLVDSVIRHAWLLRRLAAIESASFNCDCPNCADTYEGLSVAAIISTRTKRNLAHFDAIQRRINATERNYHRSLQALRDLPRAPQPTDPEPASQNLASFPRSTPEPPQTPEQAAPSSTSLENSASFPQNDFLRDLPEQYSIDSVKNPRPQTLETLPQEPSNRQ